ncbi:type II toxin-antitoxin system Phd/YefM family antitoxin [Candidatus Gottesmanbacteria bacterium]|nr:type II toxin-antitoxin system Phd/YefM family antitoxin [Candidatus Gottesmanbacteria bacterium]
MNVVQSTTLRNNLSDVIEEVSKKREYMLVARRGKIISALVDIELFEDLLALSNKKYLQSIKKAREEYEKGDILTHSEVFGEIE